MCDIEKKPPRKNEPWEPRGAKTQRGRYADCVKAAKRNHWNWLDNHLARPFPLPWQLLEWMEQENEEEEDTVQAICMNSLDQMDHYL